MLGPASSRQLGEDARVLVAATASHDQLSRAQALAWSFSTAMGVEAARGHTLAETEGDSTSAMAIVRSAGPIAEVLRAAAELEMPLLQALPIPKLDQAALEEAIVRVTPAAPHLSDCALSVVSALGLRGRIHNGLIFTGFPGVAGATAEHVAWQGAHEATVDEISAASVTFEDLELRALALMRSRARRVGLVDSHARWLAHLDLSTLGPIPDVDDST